MSDNVKTEDRIQKACIQASTQGNVNIAALARQFNVPVPRLRARVSGRVSRYGRIAPNRTLTEVQDDALCHYLDTLDQFGLSATQPMLVAVANSILRDAHTEPYEPSHQVGKDWLRRWKKAHPQYKLRKKRATAVDRYKAGNREDFVRWFTALNNVINQFDINEQDIYNFDETGFRIGIGGSQWIITRETSRESYFASQSERELVTAVETIGVRGIVLPPLLILPGKIHQSQWYTATNIPSSYAIGLSESGYSNDKLALEYIKHFDRFTRRSILGVYRLLICDRFGSHHTREFIEYAEQQKIILFGLPSYSTHLLQPLDVVVFQPLKHYHRKAVEQATRTGCEAFNKLEFLAALETIRKQTFKNQTIKSAFRTTGIWPFNPKIVIEKLRPEDVQPQRILSPPPDVPCTPYTVRSIQKITDSILERSEISPSTHSSICRLAKSALVNTHELSQTKCILAQTEAAQQARTKRQGTKRGSLQKGGVLYAEHARHMVREREKKASGNVFEILPVPNSL